MSKYLLIGAGVIVILFIGASVYFLSASNISAVVGLPMLSIGAVIVLVILLCSMAVVFASFDLQDKSQALALPEGSIRAVIALMLIVLFAILSIYLYGSLARRELSHLGVVDVTTRDTLVRTYGDRNIFSSATSDGNGFNVWLLQATSDEGIDFAKQLLVLVGTLVTSISSFYFGSKTTIEAKERAGTTTAPPVTDSLSPSIYSRGAGVRDFTIQGSSLDRITGMKFSLNGKQIAATDLKPAANQIRFKLDIPPTSEAGVWSVTLIDSRLGEQATALALTVT